MAQVEMTGSPQAELGNFDGPKTATFQVRESDNRLIGTLHLSVGGVQWRPANAQNGYWLNWADFAARMAQEED